MFSYTFMNFECIFYTSSFRSLHLQANQREKDRHSAINTEAERKNRLWNRKNKTREIYASAELNNRASSAREIINSLQMGINLPFKSFVNCDRVDMIARLLWIFFRLFSNDDDDDDSVTRSFTHSTNYCFFFSSSFIWLVHRMSVSLGSDVCIFIKTQSFCSSCCCCCCVLLFSCLFLYIAINIAWLHSARVCVCVCALENSTIFWWISFERGMFWMLLICWSSLCVRLAFVPLQFIVNVVHWLKPSE